MFLCYWCKSNFISNKLLLDHIKNIHSEKNIYVCDDNDCKRSFSIYRSFVRHRFMCHKEDSNDMIDNISEYNEGYLSNDTSENVGDTFTFFESSYSSDSDSEDEIERKNYNFQTFFDDFNNVTSTDNENKIKKELFKLYAKLYSFVAIPRKSIDEIISIFASFSKLILQNFKDQIDDKFKTSSFSSEIDQFTTKTVVDLSFDIDHIISEHLRFDAFEQHGTYVPPETVIIGERKEFKNKNDNTIYKMVPITIEFIPLRKVLKKFFELDGILDDTLNFMNNLKNSDSGIIQNFIQGELWKDKKESFAGKIVFPLCLYYDDYEPNNPLGSHKGLNKCGALYVTIESLPQKYSSKLENIFLFQLFNPLDKNYVSKEIIFNRVILELKFLEEQGILISHPSGPKQIYFSLSLIEGDNLGVHWMLGFQESFRSNYCCRFCLTHYDDFNKIFHESDCTLRNMNNYNNDVSKNDISSTGIREECIFNQLPQFHVVNNLYVDICHDLSEGIHRYDMANIIGSFIKRRIFSLTQLNIILKAFYYDPNIKNKPVEILKSHLKNKCIIMTASEMLTLVNNFSLMVGHLIPQDDNVWELFLSLKKITDICTSHKITIETPAVFEVEIHEYLCLLSELFPECFKFKHHLFIHYSRIMNLIGPLSNVSTIRKEGKHQEGKQAARTSLSRKNVNHTVAVRHQLKLNFRFFQESDSLSEFRVGPYSKEAFEIPLTLLPDNYRSENFKLLKWLKRNDLIIKKETIIILYTVDGPLFYEVKFCLHCQQSGTIMILTHKLENVHFDEHFDAFKILSGDISNYFIFTPLEIGAGLATITYKVKLNDEKFYIPKKYL